MESRRLFLFLVGELSLVQVWRAGKAWELLGGVRRLLCSSLGIELKLKCVMRSLASP